MTTLDQELTNRANVTKRLLIAARSGDIAKLETALREGANIEAADPLHRGCSALAIAAWYNDPECLKLLISAGAAIDKQSDLAWTALFYAAEEGHLECVNILIESQADVNAKSQGNHTPLTFAAKNGRLECMKALIAAGSTITAGALFAASSGGHAECVHYLIKANVDVNANNEHGRTALMLAASRGHLDCVKLLIDANADLNALTAENVSVLELSKKHPDVSRYIQSVIEYREIETCIVTPDADVAFSF